MDIKLNKLPKSQIKLEISVPALTLQGHVDYVLEKYSKDVEIKGFRKGKAPKIMTIDKIGLGHIQQESLDRAIQDAYLQAITKNKLHPITQPAVTIKKFAVNPDGSVSNDFEFDLVVDLMPEIKFGDYKKIRITDRKILNPDTTVTELEVEKVIEHLQKQKSQMKEVSRNAKDKDWVEISFDGKINKVSQEKLASKHHPLIVGSNAMVPGFEEKIIGMKAGEIKEFSLTFPKDYHSKEFASKKATFKLELHKIQEIILPEINDSFAGGYGHSTATSLKSAIKKQLEEEKKEATKQKLESAILEKARKLLKVDLPPGLIHQEVDRIIKRHRESVEKQGISFERYLDSIKKTTDDLHKEFEPQALANIEVGLILGEVIKAEKLDPQSKEAPKKAMEKLVEYAIK